MASESAIPPPPEEPKLTVSRKEATTRIDERLAKGWDIVKQFENSFDAYDDGKREYDKWDNYNNELLRRLFTTPKFANEYSVVSSKIVSLDTKSPQQKLGLLRDNCIKTIRRLESIKERLILVQEPSDANTTTSSKDRPHRNHAFIVHGHDNVAKDTVAIFLEKLGIKSVIVHEMPTGGSTIIERLKSFSDVDFAVILLTSDDVGEQKSNASNLQSRARQNVILEMGYFVGKLGCKKVCALYKTQLELPSDALGVGYVPLDDHGAWRLLLGKELKEAGFNVNLNNIV